MYRAKVKWNGNHYFAGEEVKGSKIEKREDGTTWIKQTIEIPLDTVYEILDTLGVAFKRKII